MHDSRPVDDGTAADTTKNADTPLRELIVPGEALLPVLKSMLEAAGIRHFFRHEGVQDLFGLGGLGAGYNFITGAPTLVVEAADLEAAAAILRDVEQAHDTPPWPDGDGDGESEGEAGSDD